MWYHTLGWVKNLMLMKIKNTFIWTATGILIAGCFYLFTQLPTKAQFGGGSIVSSAELILPTAGSNLSQQTSFVVQTTKTGTLRFEVASDPNTSAQKIVPCTSAAPASTAGQWTLTCDTFPVTNGQHALEVRIYDSAGNRIDKTNPGSSQWAVTNEMYFDSPLQSSYVSGDGVGVRAKVRGEVNNLRYRVIDPSGNEKGIVPAGLVNRDTNGTDWLANWNTLAPLLDNQLYRIQAVADSIYPDASGNPVRINFQETTGFELPIILNNQYCPWECTPYSQCTTTGTQTRSCTKATDANCYNLDVQPAATQSCTYVAPQVNSATLPAPTVTTPAENVELSNPLPTISGTSAPNLAVIIYLKSASIAKVVADASGRYSFKIEQPLSPGDYGVQVEQLNASGKSASTSQPRFFKILRPTGTIATPKDGDVLRGVVNMKADIKGGVKTIDFLFSGAPEISIGTGRFNPSSNLWELKADTLNFRNGEYYLFARVKDLSGTIYFTTTPAMKVKVDNPIELSSSNGTAEATVTAQPIVDSDGDGLSDAAETDIYHTNPNNPDTDGDGYTDGDEIRGGFNPLGTGTLADAVSGKDLTAIQKSIAGTAVEQPTTHGTLAADKLIVQKVQNVAPKPSENNIVFQGKGPANSIVTLYIYSNPIVVTTRTDANGNFTFTLEKDLSEGKHEVYVAIADTSGKIVEKSEPTVFFVKQARAVSEEEFFRADVNVQSDAERVTNRYLLVSGLIVILVLLIYLASRALHYGQPKQALKY